MLENNMDAGCRTGRAWAALITADTTEKSYNKRLTVTLISPTQVHVTYAVSFNTQLWCLTLFLHAFMLLTSYIGPLWVLLSKDWAQAAHSSSFFHNCFLCLDTVIFFPLLLLFRCHTTASLPVRAWLNFTACLDPDPARFSSNRSNK